MRSSTAVASPAKSWNWPAGASVKTDHAGTIEIEWDKIAWVESARQFEVATSDGRAEDLHPRGFAAINALLVLLLLVLAWRVGQAYQRLTTA